MENKLVGVIGGLGPMATSVFMEMVIDNTDANCDQDHVDLLVYQYSSIPDRTSYILGDSDNDPSEKMIEAAKLLENNNCSFIVIPCNTATYFYNKVEESVNIPVINIVEETSKLCKIYGYNKVGLMATEGTINSKIYEKYLKEKLFIPSDDIQKKISDIIYENVKKNICPSKEAFNDIVNYFYDNGCDAIITGCTELSVVLKWLDIKDERILDSLLSLARTTVLLSGKKLK